MKMACSKFFSASTWLVQTLKDHRRVHLLENITIQHLSLSIFHIMHENIPGKTAKKVTAYPNSIDFDGKYCGCKDKLTKQIQKWELEDLWKLINSIINFHMELLLPNMWKIMWTNLK